MSNTIMINESGQSYYGGYRTRTFADIFPKVDVFSDEFKKTKFAEALKPDNETAVTIDIDIVYYLLYSRYGNSHIAFSDENQFKYNVFSTIFMYGPSWSIRLYAQKKIRELGEDEIMRGSTATYNHAYNPSTLPTMESDESLGFINDQNRTIYKKSKLEAYGNLMSLIETDVTESFINKFKKLFRKIVEPDYTLIYETEVM